MKKNKMNVQVFLTSITFYSLFNSVGAIFFPIAYSAPFGIAIEESGLVFAKYLGAIALGLAVLTWSARNLSSREAIRPVLLGNFVSYGAAIVVSVYLILSRVLNPFGWILVVIDLLILFGFGFYLSVPDTN